MVKAKVKKTRRSRKVVLPDGSKEFLKKSTKVYVEKPGEINECDNPNCPVCMAARKDKKIKFIPKSKKSNRKKTK